MPFVWLASLGAIGYKWYQHKGIDIESIPDPSGLPEWSLPNPENEIDSKRWYGRFYQDDVVLGLLGLYIVLYTKPWK